jgi:hypothetical protein
VPRKFLACLLGGLLLAGCEPVTVMTENSPGPAPAARTDAAPSEPRIVPIPPIPSALRGCWFTDGPDDPEEPGAAHRLLVTAGTIELIMEGSRQVATADYVSRVSPTLIEGLFSAPDGKDRSTIATSLMFGDGGDYGPQGSLRRAEGDAGSDNYARCPE